MEQSGIPTGTGRRSRVRREGVLFLSSFRCVGVDLNIFLFFLQLSGSSSKGECRASERGTGKAGTAVVWGLSPYSFSPPGATLRAQGIGSRDQGALKGCRGAFSLHGRR